LVDLDEIKKRWGDPEEGSQYYADVHALMDEVEEDRHRVKQLLEGRHYPAERERDQVVGENKNLREALQEIVDSNTDFHGIARRSLEERND